MEEEKRKLEKNEWLTDSEFMANIDFFDPYYIIELCKKINSFRKIIPVHVVTSWDRKNKRIYFSIGQVIKYNFSVDVNISHRDFLQLVYEKVKQQFPQYKIEYKKEVDLTEEDVSLKQKEGQKLSEIVWEPKEVIIEENGIITKIQIQDDKFSFTTNNNGIIEKSIRISGNIANNKILPLSQFLKEIRLINDPEKIKNYIYENSTFVEIKSVYKEPIHIDYKGEMLLNFFKINKKFIEDEIEKVDDGHYKWGRYFINFDNDLLEKDCLNLLKK